MDDPKDQLFIQIIIDIAQTMNLTVVAEGVELKGQLNMLAKLKCDIYQGYLCSKPVKAEEFENIFISDGCYN